jgi:hypothetical protein
VMESSIEAMRLLHVCGKVAKVLRRHHPFEI